MTVPLRTLPTYLTAFSRDRPGRSFSMSRNARTFTLSRRRELERAHISTGEPDSPQQINLPDDTSRSTSSLGKSATPTPSKTASRTIKYDDRRSTGIGLSVLALPSLMRMFHGAPDANEKTTAGTARPSVSNFDAEGSDIVGAATMTR